LKLRKLYLLFDQNQVHLHKRHCCGIAGHGTEDAFISPRHSERLAAAYGGEDRRLLTFAGDHNSVRPQHFHTAVLAFFDAVLRCRAMPQSAPASVAGSGWVTPGARPLDSGVIGLHKCIQTSAGIAVSTAQRDCCNGFICSIGCASTSAACTHEEGGVRVLRTAISAGIFCSTSNAQQGGNL